MNVFKSFDAFLNSCVTYIDTRVKTGKFIYDIDYYSSRAIRFIRKKSRKVYFFLKRSPGTAIVVDALEYFWNLLMKIPIANIAIKMIGETLRIIVICYSEIFIVFAITFPASILLLTWFQTSIVTFCIALIPTLTINLIALSALFYSIDRRELGDKISIWKSILFVIRHLGSIIFPIIIESAIILEALIIFFLIPLFLSRIFDIYNIAWGGSIFYWFVVSFVASLTAICIFTVSVLTPQTYFSILIDHLPFHKALQSNTAYIKSKLSYYLFFYLILYIACAIFTIQEVLTYLYFGLTVGLYITIILSFLLGFLLRKKLHPIKEPYAYNFDSNEKIHIFFKALVVFGFINFILVSTLLVKEYKPFLSFIQQQQDNYLASQRVKTYVNYTYGYSLEYPQNWSFYQWQSNSVTFYNNYTRTLSGGTWMTITIQPLSESESNFDRLSNASPGVVPDDTGSKNITTKVSNMTIQGYQAVNYLFIKPSIPYTEYESHYLILKQGDIYDISFTSVTNDVASYNSDLFQKIINSFRFTR